MIRNILQQSIRRLVTGIIKDKIPRMYFCQSKKNDQKVNPLLEALQKQYKDNQSQNQKSLKFGNLKILIVDAKPKQLIKKKLQQDGWRVSYNNNRVQLNKTTQIIQEGVTNTYKVKLIAYARSAKLNQNKRKKKLIQMFTDEQMQIFTFVQKEGNKKWLVGNFLIISQNEMNLRSFYTVSNLYSFITSFEEGVIEIQNYMGPQINTIAQQLQQGILLYLQSLGFKLQVFSSARDLVSQLQRQLALQWINDFKSFC